MLFVLWYNLSMSGMENKPNTDKNTTNKDIIIDHHQEYFQGIKINSDLAFELMRVKSEFGNIFINDTKKQLEVLKPAFKDFFKNVIEQRPDYIILLDKGARPFGIPFEHFLKKLNLDKNPKIIFWNDSRYKNEFDDTLSQKNAVDEYNKNKQFHGKKIFFFDEDYQSGRGSEMLKKIFNESDIDGQYFALNYYSQDSRRSFQEKFGNDKRFHVCIGDNQEYCKDNFPQLVSQFYVTDNKSDNFKTIKRFEHVNLEKVLGNIDNFDDVKLSPEDQDILKQIEDFYIGVRRKIQDMIFNTLLEVDLESK